MSLAWYEIHDHLMRSSFTLRFQQGFAAIRRANALISRFADHVALLDTLQQGPDDPDSKNRILKGLVEIARCDGPTGDCALSLILLALWPGLDGVRRRLLWAGTGAIDDVSSDILARACEIIRTLDLRRVNRIAATIVRNVERDTIRKARRQAVWTCLIDDRIDPDELAREHSSPDLVPRLLRQDIDRVAGADAPLVIRVALQGATRAEVASQFGLSEAAARKRCQRAARKLRQTLQEFA